MEDLRAASGLEEVSVATSGVCDLVAAFKLVSVLSLLLETMFGAGASSTGSCSSSFSSGVWSASSISSSRSSGSISTSADRSEYARQLGQLKFGYELFLPSRIGRTHL